MRVGTDRSDAPARPFAVAWTPDGKSIVVANFRTNNVSLVDIEARLRAGLALKPRVPAVARRLDLRPALPFHEGRDLLHQFRPRPQVRRLPRCVRDGIPNTGVTLWFLHSVPPLRQLRKTSPGGVDILLRSRFPLVLESVQHVHGIRAPGPVESSRGQPSLSSVMRISSTPLPMADSGLKSSGWCPRCTLSN